MRVIPKILLENVHLKGEKNTKQTPPPNTKKENNKQIFIKETKQPKLNYHAFDVKRNF